jgi:hypothetical protein
MKKRVGVSADASSGILHFIRANREVLEGEQKAVRIVYRSELVRKGLKYELDNYISDRAPLFYRSLNAIMADLKAGYFLTAIKNTLSKMPTVESFQESHFGEIVAGIFAEEVLGLRRLYSKLSFLTSENANAYKMDLVMYDPVAEPIQFIFGEVKCSPKCDSDGLPANHHKSCYANLFESMNKYLDADQSFDLTAASDNLANIPEEDMEKVREGLKPYSDAMVGYAGFIVIDSSTFCSNEAQVLRNRKNNKDFEIDIVCLEAFKKVAGKTYTSLLSYLKL